jgi:hypothetical protein
MKFLEARGKNTRGNANRITRKNALARRFIVLQNNFY